MKLLPCLALVILSALPSCEKVRDLSTRLSKKAAPAVPVAVGAVGSAPVVELSAESYATFPQQSGKVVLIDFYADWCGPCRKLSPILEKIADEHGGNVTIGKVNVDKCGEIATREGVRGIPDVRIYRDGKVVDQFVGLAAESVIREKIASAVKGLPPPAPAIPIEKKEASIKPMRKDWLPEGIKRR